MASKRIKYLEINVTEVVQDLHAKNHKTALRDIKDLNKCDDIPFSLI